MAVWLQSRLQLMQKDIFVFAVVSLLCRHPGEKRNASVQTDAGTNGGIRILIRLTVKPITILYVYFARNHLYPMEIKIESTAATSAISQTDLEVIYDERIHDRKRR